jgi:drug/metabolite transporter (DMT)-like permease
MASTCTEIERPITPLESLRAKPSRRVPLAFAAVYILWGSTFLGIRIAIETIPPLTMAAMRHSLVGLILYPILRVKTGIRPKAAHWWTAAVTGVSLLCISNGGLSWAEQRVPSGIAALLIATISLWLVILDWLRPRGTRPGPRVIVGLVVGFAGMALLVGPAKLGGARRIDVVGAGVLVVASFVWACASLYSKQRTMPAPPLLVVAMQSLAGGAALWIAAIVSGEFRAVHLAAISGRSWMALIYLVVFGSGMGFTAYLYILKNSTASKVATYAFVNPVVALFLGWTLAGETITTRTAIAAAVILTAVVLVISAPPAQVAEVGDD